MQVPEEVNPKCWHRTCVHFIWEISFDKMSFNMYNDIASAVSVSWFESMSLWSGVIDTEAAYWGTDEEEGPDAQNRVFNPALNNNIPNEGDIVGEKGEDFDYDLNVGGSQPSHEFSARGKKAEPPNPWYEVSLFNPFRLAFHNLKVPVLGRLSFVIEKTKNVGLVVYSLVYMALPTLAWFLGVDNKSYVKVNYRKYRPLPHSYEDPVRCDVCGDWTTPEDFLDNDDFKMQPWLLCFHRLKEINFSPHITRALQTPLDNDFVNNCKYTSYADLASKLAIPVTCNHEDHGEQAVGYAIPPRPTLDGLYMHGDGEQWKFSNHMGGLRCHTCYRTTLHGWHPQLITTVIEKGKAAPGPFALQMMRMITRWAQFLSQYKKDSTVYVLALSADRIKYHSRITGNVIVLYSEEQLPFLVKKQLGTLGCKNYRFFRVPEFGFNTRFLANVRVFLVYNTMVPLRFVVCNQRISTLERVYIDHMLTSPYDSVSGTPGHFYPAYAGALVVKGRTCLPMFIHMISSLYWCGCLYGWDEIYPTYKQKNLAVIYSSLTTPNLMMGLTSFTHKGPKTAIMITNELEHPQDVFSILWTRQSVYWVNRLAGSDVDPGRLTFWHVWADPRPTFTQYNASSTENREAVPDEYKGVTTNRTWFTKYEAYDTLPDFGRVIAPGDNIIQELAASLGGITLFTIGTRGDVQPFEALGRHIAAYGVPVRLYVLNTPEEGKILLDSALGKRSDNSAVHLFNRCRTTMLENVTGATLVHSALMTGDVPTLDMSPPPDLITARTVGGSWFMSLGSAILGVWYQPSARVGSYTGPRVVPTSADGVNFIKPKQNRGKYEIGAIWGSDVEPPSGFEDIPLVPPGDHIENCRDFKRVICHGGAGTIASIHAAGAQAIVYQGGLDRSRRNPYDAGLGLMAGADPDNIWLVLADQDVRFFAVWLRRNLWRPWKLWAFYGFPGLGWAAFRVVMLYVLYNKSFKGVPVSSEPLLVLYGVLGGNISSWVAFVGLIIASKSVDTLLDYLNISYMRILTSFLGYNFRMSVSPVGLYLASRYNIGVGLMYSMMSPWLYKVVQQTLQAYSNVILGIADRIKPDGESHPKVYLEFSPRIYMGVPVVHTALVCPALDRRFEGQTSYGLYILKDRQGGVESPILVPTSLTWEDVLKIPHYSGKYSLAWNCQTSIIVALKNRYVSLGPGGIFLYATSVFAAGIYTINAAAVTVLWSLVQLLPATLEPSTVRPSYIDIGGGAITSLWNRLSVTGEWDPVGVLRWWRSLYMPF